ncbi:hypothetical protein SASPL_117339 [Salvia splendens]|uniref:Sugar phosphate transporter domain-containing protein n=1 Tax=Salvia splendens TaxID=180675 RepID=A0A8X8XZ36_SALSN|nr:hypothetical protein SASPL_117339 [Salvia splendens]
MISSLKQPASFSHGSYFLTSRTNLVTPGCLPVLPSLRLPRISVVSLSKPLHIGAPPIERKRKELSTSIGCSAYEADRSEPVADARSESARKIKIGIYFATWWSLNVVFNIYNKKVLNAYPYPWLTSTLSLAAGSLIMLVSWALRIAETPKTDLEFWKSLFPVAVAHTIGHVAATVSMSKVAVSFTHIIKSGEPAFSVLVSRFILGETFPPAVYLSLIPIIGGCGLSALTELNFNMIVALNHVVSGYLRLLVDSEGFCLLVCFFMSMSKGFMGAMISNLAFVFRNIFSKKGMKGKSVSGMNYYACLSMLSLVILTPFAIAVEGPQMWAAGFQQAFSDIGPQIVWWMAAQSVFYHLYNQVSYMSLDEISPLTFSIGNTMKRISVIVSSIIIFQTPVQPVNALGAAIAVLGTFLYSQNYPPLCKEVKTGEARKLQLKRVKHGVLESGSRAKSALFTGALKTLIRMRNLHVIALFEPRISGIQADRTIRRIGLPNSYREEANGFSGGIWLLWDDHWHIEILETTSQYIHCRIWV